MMAKEEEEEIDEEDKGELTNLPTVLTSNAAID